MNDSPSILTELVARADRLYTLPAVAAQVLELCRQPRIDSRALKRCIERDPALTARLLKTVNSSLFGLRQPVTDLNQALGLLGTKALKMLVLSFSLPEELFAGQEVETLSRYWRHTLIKAVAARELAEQIWRYSGDEAFIAGLLQDIGQLVLLQQLGEPYRRFVNHVTEQGGDLLALETQSLGFDHAVISARLLQKWGLPASLIEAIGRPLRAGSDPPAASDANAALVEILRLAELLARLFTQHQPYALREVLEIGERSGRLHYDQLQDLVACLDQKVAELGDAFALYPQGGATLVELLAQANAQLSDLAFDLYGDVSRLAEELQAAVRTAPSETLLASPTRPRGDETVFRSSASAAGASVGDSVRYDDAGRTRQQSVMSCLAGQSSDDPGLVGRIAAAIASGRQQHRPVSLVLFEIDRYSDWVFALGPERAAAAERLLQAAATQLSPQGGKCLAVGEARYALLWDCDRREAAQSGRLLGQALANWWDQRQEAAALTVSIGIATLAFPSKNFPPRELLTPAQRCLSAANLSGGNCVKSIEV
jgi:HD-like signal output (HDOD) protein/GGDEF domain-containing protein